MILPKKFFVSAIGCLLLLLSALFVFYDKQHSDEQIFQSLERNIQADFNELVGEIKKNSPKSINSAYPVCHLTYDLDGKLANWDNQHSLPPFAYLVRIGNLPNTEVLNFSDKIYYQIRKRSKDTTHLFLIPISIHYNISNDFLRPYVFLGRYYAETDLADLQQIRLGTLKKGKPLVLRNPMGVPLFYIENLSSYHFRAKVRILAFALGLLGLFLLVFSTYRYVKFKTKSVWKSDLLLIFVVILVRTLMTWFNLPQSYIPSTLFSAETLAFHWLSPSLGDLSLNVAIFTGISYCIYRNIFDKLIPWGAYFSRYKQIAWLFSLISIFLSCLILKGYFLIFREIIINSQIGINFSNIFRTDYYSYIILLVVGLLLLGCYALIICLLKFNVALIPSKEIRAIGLISGIHISIAFLCTILMFDEGVWELFLVPLVLVVLGISLYRLPTKMIFNYDLLNLLLLIGALSLVISTNIMSGTEVKKQRDAEQIASNVFRDRSRNIIMAYQNAIYDIERDMPAILGRYSAMNNNDFMDWFKYKYFTVNFNATDIELFMFDTTGNRLDTRETKTPLDPINASNNSAELIASTGKADGKLIDKGLHQLIVYDKTSDDMYLGHFELHRDTLMLLFSLEVYPNRLDIAQIYPALLQDKDAYRQNKATNTFDFAIYRDGYLHSSSGKSTFPIKLPGGDSAYNVPIHRSNGEFNDYYEPVDGRKVVTVRYSRPHLSEFINSFSFIFSFFALLAVIMIVVGIVATIVATRELPKYEWNFRNKVQFILLTVSIIPLFFIILFLLPTVKDRFYQQMNETLKLETNRITDAVAKEYTQLREGPFRVLSDKDGRDFQKKVQELGVLLRSDINVYDEAGRQIASTKPLIVQTGISSGMMNDSVYRTLRQGNFPEMIVQESIGTLEYQSGFKVMYDKKPIGYVNVPYLAKQDEIDEKVFDILAYLINIYLAVILLGGVITIVISKQITRPLQIIQQRLTNIKLGDVNEKIDYEARDEIGEIISAYNQMVGKLAESEKKLAQTQRDLAWRQMARQVAHEIKNPLTPMKLGLQHLSRAWNEKSANLEKMFPKVVSNVLVQIDSLARIADTFSEFAKMPEAEKNIIYLNEVLHEVADLYEQSQSGGMEVSVSIPDKPFYVYADRDQISRVFNNVIKNAIQAIESTDKKGALTISMRLEPNMAFIQIQDNGSGMSEDVKKKAFEPNFSTKSSGMGLGLAIVRRIIETSGGTIYFESQEGVGTTFFIDLPAAEPPKGQF